MLEIKKISFSYNRNKILEEIDLTIEQGKIVGLIGENGVGKTTFMKIVSGIYIPQSGELTCNANRIGALIENPWMYTDLSVYENMKFFAELYTMSQDIMQTIMKNVGIWDYRKKIVNKLSLGMKQRVGVAIAMLASDEFILLDEPTNGLDPVGIRSFLSMIKNVNHLYGTTFIISSHIFQNLEGICDEVYRIQNRKIFDIYDMPGKYTHYLTFPMKKRESILELLNRKDISYDIRNEKVLLENKMHDKKFLKALDELETTIHRRTLQEVYFE